jgi:hypothetical protein
MLPYVQWHDERICNLDISVFNFLYTLNIAFRVVLNFARLAIECVISHYRKLRGMSPRKNYSDRATAACRRS